MKPLSKAIGSMPRSGIRAFMDLAWATPGCIHLEVGEPNFATPSHIVDAASQAARDGRTKYTPNSGTPELREVIARKVRRKLGLEVTLDQITVTPGATTAVATALMAIAEPGDAALIPDPGWPNYEMMATCLGVNTIPYPMSSSRGFQLDFEALDRVTTNQVKVLMLSTPANPTGAVLTEDEIRKVVEFADERDIYVISDEVYEDIIFEGSHTSPAEFDSDGRVVVVSGVSKSYAMTGWRIGYAVASKRISELITKLQEPFVSCASSISQKAAEAAIGGPQDCVVEMTNAYKARRDIALAILRENGLYTYTPQGTFYLMIELDSCGVNSFSFARSLLEKYKVAVAPGEAFGKVGENFVRISLATAEEDLIEGLERICQHIHSLRDGIKSEAILVKSEA